MELLPLFLVFAVVSGAGASPPSVRLNMVHHHQVDPTFRSLTPSQQMRELLGADQKRHANLSAHINGSTIRVPMTAGRDLGIGQYLVEVSVGSPPQKFRLIADTGSELMWMKCRYNKKSSKEEEEVVKFEPGKSSTFEIVTCSSKKCKQDLKYLFTVPTCPTPSSPCSYDYRYFDESRALGMFAYETVTVDYTEKDEQKSSGWEPAKVERMLVGCTLNHTREAFQVSDGMLGLAYSNNSFISKARQQFGSVFSYCLVNHLSHMNLSSYLTFGPPISTPTPNMRYTKLDLDALPPYYGVSIEGISIGGKMLDIPSETWDPARGGGTILDSGTSLTFLAEPAYKQVVDALEGVLNRYKKLGQGVGPMDYCFKATQDEFNQTLVPRIRIHFSDGARFEPPVKSYVIDVEKGGVKCLGLVPVKWPGMSVIGNIMQQNHLWAFNLEERKLGYGTSSCITQ